SAAHRKRRAHWANTRRPAEGSEPHEPRGIAAAEAWGEYVTYLDALLGERRAHPQNDLISVLLSSAEADELNADELISFLVLLLVAGNETTRNALSGGMCALTQFSD